MTNHDPINNPSHYTSGGIETIDYMRAKLSPAEFRGYLRGNVIKYASRMGAKGDGAQAKQDAGKLAWYAARLAEVESAEQEPVRVSLDLSAGLELSAPTLLRGAKTHTLLAKLRKMAEEATEVIDALAKYHAGESPLSDVLAEVADVVIVAAQIAEMANVPIIEKARKFARQLDREESRNADQAS